MSKRSWARWKRSSLAVVCLLLTACASGGALTPLPTQPLIPATPTFTSLPPTPTPTPAAVLRAGDLETRVPPSLLTLEMPDERDLAQQVLENLLESQQLAPNLVRLVALEPVDWGSEDAECQDETPPFTVAGYRLLWLSGVTVYEYHTGDEDAIRLCRVQNVREVTGRTLTLVDPVAAELVVLARQRLAEALDLPSRRVELVTAQAVTWPDTSLGCPEPEQTYTAQAIDGYHLLFAVNDDEYAFNTDFDRVLACDLENVVLPGR